MKPVKKQIGRDDALADALILLNKKQLKLLISVQGILCDLIGGFLEFFGKEYLLKTCPKGEYDLKKVTGHAFTDLPLILLAHLKPTEEFQYILQRCNKHLVGLAINSSDHFQTFANVAWIRQYLPGIKYVQVTSTTKNILQPPEEKGRVILIDDCDAEIQAWEGPSILLPRPWNSAIGDPIKVLDRCISHFELEGI